MKILHLTDFHLKADKVSSFNKQIKISKIINDKLKNEKDIDFVFFTGDLVFSGDKALSFAKAKELLLDSITSTLGINYDQVFICPGNHDINRSVSKNSIIKYLDEDINTNELLEAFSSGKNSDFIDSLKPSENYFQFVSDLFGRQKQELNDQVTELYTAHVRSVGGKKIGIVAINTSWRAVGRNDRGNLLFPISKIEEALDHIKESEIKIILHHHPLNYLREFNENRIDDIIHNEFNIALSGHIHKNSNSIVLTANDGIIKIGASAALAPGEIAEMGFSLVEFDYDELQFTVYNKYFDKRSEVLYDVPHKQFAIPTSEEKIKQNKFRLTLRKRYESELKNANDLCLSAESGETEGNFLSVFTSPVLKTKSVTELLNDDERLDEEISIDQLIIDAKDYLIFGSDKCGKSSLLRKIQVDLLKNYSLKESIPFYLNANDYKSNWSKLNIEELFKNYFETNYNEVERILNSQKILLLIDNYNQKYLELNNKISQLINSRPDIKLIICAAETFSKAYDNFAIQGRSLNKLHFHKLKKKHIRQLASKWPDLQGEIQDEIVQKIESIFTRLAIPFNFWTVSLFLWIFKKNSDKSFQSDFGLIDLYIESIVEREILIRSKASFGYEKYKKYLASLAAWLYVSHSKNTYSATHIEILNFTEDYLNKNPRNDIEPREVFEYIESKGIIKKISDDSAGESIRYTFRLNGVFEYFLAYRMTMDAEFKGIIVNDRNKYLAFANEFEMYAGFTKNDKSFLNEIFEKTQDIYSVLDERYNDGTSLDTHLKSKILEANEFQRNLERVSNNIKSLTHLEQDEVEDEVLRELGLKSHEVTEVKLKQTEEINKEAVEVLEKSLQILGRVFKNTDDIDDEDLVYKVFDYIIDKAAFWGFKIIDEAKLFDVKELSKLLDDKGEKQFLKVVLNFIPTLVQVHIHDIVGQRNLQRIIKKRIEDLKHDKKNNQYKLFLLYFLLIDIDLLNNKKYIDEVIDCITIPVLKYSILLKLNYYLGFKTNNDKELTGFFRNKIQVEQLRFDKDTSLGAFHQSLEKTQKKALNIKKK